MGFGDIGALGSAGWSVTAAAHILHSCVWMLHFAPVEIILPVISINTVFLLFFSA